MINNFVKTFETYTSFTYISIKKSDSDDNIRKFAKLSDFFRSSQGHKRPETCTWKNTFECSSNFTFNSIIDCISELNLRVVANNVLFVLVKKVVENFLVKKRDAFKVVTRTRLKTDNFINESVWVMGKIGDILLSGHFLSHISRVISNLEFDGV